MQITLVTNVTDDFREHDLEVLEAFGGADSIQFSSMFVGKKF